MNAPRLAGSLGACAIIIGLATPGVLQAQSGRATLNGWVMFEGVAYVDQQPKATVELRHPAPDTTVAYSTKTDEHGFYHFPSISLGEFVLHIWAPHFREYRAEVYIPSDFAGNWATLLKKRD
ncbi:MAG: carboxypeptidase-like regulatory domain-containing protein [Gemmatimonadota bacterium]